MVYYIFCIFIFIAYLFVLRLKFIYQKYSINKLYFLRYLDFKMLIMEDKEEKDFCNSKLHSFIGLLSMVLESFVHGFVPDISFIPISMSFEKITEESLYMFELLGIPKPKESLRVRKCLIKVGKLRNFFLYVYINLLSVNEEYLFHLMQSQ